MSKTPPNETYAGVVVPPFGGAYGSVPHEKKTAADSIGSDSDGSHQYGTGDVFAQGGQQQYYEPIEEYEGRHRYDPAAQWTEAEEKKLIRRVRADCLSWSPIPEYLLFFLAAKASSTSARLGIRRPLLECIRF
jgi:hypothetical protein